MIFAASSFRRSRRRALKATGFVLALLVLPVSARTLLPATVSTRLETEGREAPARIPPPARTVVPRRVAGEPAGECQRVRRKLWLEDEGWVVRAVTRC
jgi:hypothetical protein